MLRKYSGHCWYWEIKIILRKMFIAIIFLLTTKYPVIQIISSFLVISHSFYDTWKHTPFRCAHCEERLDEHIFEIEELQKKDRSEDHAKTKEHAEKHAANPEHAIKTAGMIASFGERLKHKAKSAREKERKNQEASTALSVAMHHIDDAVKILLTEPVEIFAEHFPRIWS